MIDTVQEITDLILAHDPYPGAEGVARFWEERGVESTAFATFTLISARHYRVEPEIIGLAMEMGAKLAEAGRAKQALGDV